jgi:large subunit ribosomal protein L25
MATVNLNVQSREETGKGPARRLRATGQIPVILYGVGFDESKMLAVDAKELSTALSTSAGARVVFKLALEGGGETMALIKSLQREPVSRAFVHADLIAIDLNEPVDLSIPIHAVGTPVGVKMEGGVLEWARREIAIRVLPTAIPEFYELDISEMHVGSSVHVGDLVAEGFEISDDPEQTICGVKSTKLEEEPVEEDEDAVAAEGDAAPDAAEDAPKGE